MVERLDEERIEILRRWSAGLASDTRAELRAAGKAIVILIEEIDRLQADIQRARGSNRPLVAAADGDVEQTTLDLESSHVIDSSIRERLGVVIPSRASFDRDE